MGTGPDTGPDPADFDLPSWVVLVCVAIASAFVTLVALGLLWLGGRAIEAIRQATEW